MCADWALGFAPTISDSDCCIGYKRMGRLSCCLMRLLVKGVEKYCLNHGLSR